MTQPTKVWCVLHKSGDGLVDCASFRCDWARISAAKVTGQSWASLYRQGYRTVEMKRIKP